MEDIKKEYVKRTQKDYSLSLKLQIVEEVERGLLSLGEAKRKYGIQGDRTVKNWLEKYGNFDWAHKISNSMQKKTAEQELLELKKELELAKKKINRLEHQVSQADQKSIIFDMMIDLAEKEYKIDIRKNSSPK